MSTKIRELPAPPGGLHLAVSSAGPWENRCVNTSAGQGGNGRRGNRDRDEEGRARNARPRDGLGRPLPYDTPGTERQPEGVQRTPEQSLVEGQRLLDEGKPFHAHEVFEDAWKLSDGQSRLMWRAMAQLAVGVTHAARGNRTGAVSLLRRGADGIEPYSGDPPFGMDIAGVVHWARAAVESIDTNVEGPAELTPPRLRARE